MKLSQSVIVTGDNHEDRCLVSKGFAILALIVVVALIVACAFKAFG